MLERLGITPGLIRLSVGLEDPKDLWSDFAGFGSKQHAGRSSRTACLDRPVSARAAAPRRGAGSPPSPHVRTARRRSVRTLCPAGATRADYGGGFAVLGSKPVPGWPGYTSGRTDGPRDHTRRLPMAPGSVDPRDGSLPGERPRSSVMPKRALCTAASSERTMLATSRSGDCLTRRSPRVARVIALEINNDEVFAGIEQLRQMVIAMAADPLAVVRGIENAPETAAGWRRAGRSPDPQAAGSNSEKPDAAAPGDRSRRPVRLRIDW